MTSPHIPRLQGEARYSVHRRPRQAPDLLEERSHQELATAIEEDAVLLARLTRYAWRVILVNGPRDALMDRAATGELPRSRLHRIW